MTTSTRPFLVLGSMKSGTASLEKILKAHHRVTLVAEKESTLCSDAEGAREFLNRVGRASGEAAGEVSTGYLQAPLEHIDHAAVAEVLGRHTRLIAILRDPFRRAVSHWQHWEQLGRNTVPLAEALQRPDLPYAMFSRYADQLRPWTDAFGEENLTLIRLEDFQSNRQLALEPVWRSLGVDDLLLAEEVHENARESRVVARTGTARGIRTSRAYGRVRHLVPTSAKRAVLQVIGGTRSTTAPALDVHDRREFLSMIGDDLDRLSARYPGMTWEAGNDG